MKPNGTSIRALRESKHIGVRELARRVGVSHQFLGRLQDCTGTASPETMARLASELGVPVEAIAYPEPVGASR